MMNFNNLNFKRVFNYFFGLFLITLGVAFSIKSNLGSAPVSSIPYALNLIWNIEIGVATFLFHAFLVLIELILLRRNFHMKHFFQVFVGVVFGSFTSFSVSLMTFIPPADSLLTGLIMTFLSIFFIAGGLFFYVPTNIIPLSVEGVTQAFAIVFNNSFSKTKVMVDVCIVLSSLILSWIFLGNFGSVGIGTVLEALLIGLTVKLIHYINRRVTGISVDLKKM